MMTKRTNMTPHYTGSINQQCIQWKLDSRICSECGFALNDEHIAAVFDGKAIEVFCPTVYADNKKEVCPDVITGLKSHRRTISGGKAKVSDRSKSQHLEQA